MKIYTSHEIQALTFAQLAIVYNVCADYLGEKLVKKFRDKPTGRSKIRDIQLRLKNKLSEKQIVPELKLNNDTLNYDLIAEVKAPVEREFEVNSDKVLTGMSALSLIQGLVAIHRLESKIIRAFVGEYSKVYKGASTVNGGFAKGYIAGALRQNLISEVK